MYAGKAQLFLQRKIAAAKLIAPQQLNITSGLTWHYIFFSKWKPVAECHEKNSNRMRRIYLPYNTRSRCIEIPGATPKTTRCVKHPTILQREGVVTEKGLSLEAANIIEIRKRNAYREMWTLNFHQHSIRFEQSRCPRNFNSYISNTT